jgi:hypothetical protein
VTDDGITEDVRAFIAEYIDSVEQLEILLLLRRTAPKEWSATAVSQELYISPESAARRLEEFHRAGICSMKQASPEPLYWYNPNLREMDMTIGRLASTYEERRVRVINLIFSRPVDHIRSFADAFRIRKNED